MITRVLVVLVVLLLSFVVVFVLLLLFSKLTLSIFFKYADRRGINIECIAFTGTGAFIFISSSSIFLSSSLLSLSLSQPPTSVTGTDRLKRLMVKIKREEKRREEKEQP